MVEHQFAKTGDSNKLASSKSRFEGDILVRKTSGGSQLSAVFQDRIWPDAKIPYQISNDYSIHIIYIHFQMAMNFAIIFI